MPVAARPFLIFFSLAATIFLCKLPTLDAPYYWDEINWSEGAYWLSEVGLFRAIPGLHPPDTFLGRPPALHVTLASLFKVFGPSITTAHLLILVFAILGVCSTYVLGRYVYDAKTGVFSSLCLFLSPLYFVQSNMFLADLPVASLGVLCIYFALREKYFFYLVGASYLVFLKETSVFLIASLLIFFCLQAPRETRQTLTRLLKYSVPLFEISLFLVWQKLITGHFSATYDHHALFNFAPRFVFHQSVMITKWLFFYQERYILSALIILNFVFNRESRKRKESLLFLLILLLSSYSFAILYPYFLPRYLLPALPYLYLMGVWSLMALVKPPIWKISAAVALLFFMLWSLINQPFTGNAEVNLRYLDVVKLHKEISKILVTEFPSARIVTAWPHTLELQRPHLGYVSQALSAASFRDKGGTFSVDEQNLRAADLILVSPVPGTPAMNELRTYALNNNWRLLRRLEKDPVVAELYRRPWPP
jgi:4-amino-4-deoxy-L-arabinose transferase-like glycosyltransferase